MAATKVRRLSLIEIKKNLSLWLDRLRAPSALIMICHEMKFIRARPFFYRLTVRIRKQHANCLVIRALRSPYAMRAYMPLIINYEQFAITVDKLTYLKIKTSKLNVPFIFVKGLITREFMKFLSISPKRCGISTKNNCQSHKFIDNCESTTNIPLSRYTIQIRKLIDGMFRTL